MNQYSFDNECMKDDNLCKKNWQIKEKNDCCKPFPLIIPPGVLNYADFYASLDNAAALTITPLAGGTASVSAHLVITQIA